MVHAASLTAFLYTIKTTRKKGIGFVLRRVKEKAVFFKVLFSKAGAGGGRGTGASVMEVAQTLVIIESTMSRRNFGVCLEPVQAILAHQPRTHTCGGSWRNPDLNLQAAASNLHRSKFLLVNTAQATRACVSRNF